MDGEKIQTSLGRIWIKVDEGTGGKRLWQPYGSRSGELAASALRGKARWRLETKGWRVAAKRGEEI